MQEVVPKDWSEKGTERLSDLSEVTQYPNCLCVREGKKVKVRWVIVRLWVGQGEKKYFVQKVLWCEALSTVAGSCGRPGQLPVQFGRQQSEEVQLVFSKNSSAAAQTAWEMLKFILRHEIYAQLVEWQAEIMGVWKLEGLWASFRFSRHSFTHVTAMTTAASPNWRHQ